MSTSARWENQIVRYADEAPDQLLASPLNARVHPKYQQDVLGAVLDEIGWITPVIVNEVTQHVIDGHLRIELAISRGEPTVPVAYVRLTPEAERLALATFDPISSLAVTDSVKLAELLESIETDSESIQKMLDDLLEASPNLSSGDVDHKAAGGSGPTEIACPNCGYLIDGRD